MLGARKYAGSAGLVLSLMLGGCLFGPKPHVFAATFVPIPIPESTGNPTNIVEGHGFEGVEDDAPRTCVATLRPYVRSSAYERELDGLSEEVRGATALDPAYEEHQRQIRGRSMTAHCDVQGKFLFENVPNGVFVISARVEKTSVHPITALVGSVFGVNPEQMTPTQEGWTDRTGVVIPEGSSGQTYTVDWDGGLCEALDKHLSPEDKAKWNCDG